MKTPHFRNLASLWLAALGLVLAACASGPGSVPTKAERPVRSPAAVIEPVAPAEVDSFLHVPSPDWRDQVIYMIVTDRFEDAVPGNSDQKAGEYNPSENAFYSGGDLAGILAHLDYIKGLGMTSLWITPPVANQWWDPWVKYSGYHGYWARDFKKVDEHYGTLEDYKLLSATLHKNGMYLIQDIVLNHVGNFFRWKGGWDKSQPQVNFQLNEESLHKAPGQPPFDLNDPRDPEQKKQAIYHWTPDIRDYKNPVQLLTYQVSSLDDLNTSNPLVRRALRDSYAYWIKNVGVDGMRIDTIKYVEHEFLNDFLYNAADAEAPGVIPAARALGKERFFVTGENLVNGAPFDESVDQAVAAYQGTADKPEVPYPLNFPLAWDIRSVFTEGAATSALSFRLASQKKHFRGLDQLPHFIDSHDIDRFLKLGNPGAFEQALAMIFTIPGIPVILYGTEQNFTQTRGSMFPDGYASGGQDHFDPNSASYQWIKRLSALRRAHPVFTRGDLTVLKDSRSGPGVFAYRMERDGQSALAIFNSAAGPTLAAHLLTGLAPGSRLELALSNREDSPSVLVAGNGGSLDLELAPQSVGVYLFRGESAAFSVPALQAGFTGLTAGQSFTGNAEIRGLSSHADKVELIVDGNLAKAVHARLSPEDGAWTAALDVESLSAGPHVLVARAIANGVWTASEELPFIAEIPFRTVLTDDSPVAHHLGPRGQYRYPTDGTFKTQMDIASVSLATAGKSLRVTIKPKGGVSTSWNPQYGFDHVSYSVYIGLPGQPGQTVMPFQNAGVPEGFSWNYLALVGGWANFLYTSEGSGPAAYGTPAKPASQIRVDPEAGTVELTILAEALGFPKTLSGARVYIATWDYDGIESAYRHLEPQPQQYIMGGGDGKRDALIMDDTKVLAIP